MLQNISVKNFRSIEEAEVELSPITVFYGPTSSGKSTLLYAPLVLRNFVLSPNQQPDGLFNLGFMNLGGFEACIFNHDKERGVTVAIAHGNAKDAASYGFSLWKSSADLRLKSGSTEMEAKVSVPYALNQTFTSSRTEGQEDFTINWNGISCSVVPKNPTAQTQERARKLATTLNASGEILKRIDIAPHKRGFFKASYTPVQVSVSPPPTTEDEVASVVINDNNLPARISAYAEEILGRDFRTQMPPGTATVFFKTTEKNSRIPVDLVNDGFGVNQIIYLLSKILRVDVDTLLVEEPEIHLHPTIIRKFVRVLHTLVHDEGKQILLTTHSEQLLISLLALVSEGTARPDDLRFYLTTKDRRTTVFKKQSIKSNGQVEGGLSSFVEAELDDLMRFLGGKPK